MYTDDTFRSANDIPINSMNVRPNFCRWITCATDISNVNVTQRKGLLHTIQWTIV